MINLDRACSIDDVCIDPESECKDGYCVCRDNYYDMRGTCGKW